MRDRNPQTGKAKATDSERMVKHKDQEKEGPKALWDQLRSRLTNLSRAEQIWKRRVWKEKAHASFLSDPFRYALYLLEKK